MPNLEGKSDINEAANAIRSRWIEEQDSDHTSSSTLGEMASRKNLGKYEKISVKKNGVQEKKSEVDSKEEKLPRRPKAARPGSEGAVEKSEEEDRPEWEEKMSEIVKPGNAVLPKGEEGKVFDSNSFWVLKEVLKDEEGEETLHLVLEGRDGYEAGSLGRSWEQITPQYEDEDSYVDKLKTIREALERAEEAGDDYRADKLADLLKQVYVFAAEFIEKNSN